MTAQNKLSEHRVYRTNDGELVGENDPRAAFLAYAKGTEVPGDKVPEYDAFVKSLKGTGDPATDEAARAALREKLHPASGQYADHTQPIGERLATELADEQREIANRGADAVETAAQVQDPDRVVAQVAVGANDKGDLVAATDPTSTRLMYAEGDEIVDPAHRKAYAALSEAAEAEADATDPADADPVKPDPVDPGHGDDPAKAKATPSNKAVKTADNK
jgi:hypothetical protein